MLFHQPTQHVAPTLSMNTFFKFRFYFMILRRVYKSALATRDGRARCKELMTKMLRLSPQSVMNGPSAQCEERLQDGAEILNSTVEALKDGQVVAVPTDTIYGLACLAQNSNAIKKVYDIKGRKGQKPLAICVGEIKDIYKYCKVSVKEELIGELLPGPVTLVLERAEVLNTDLNPFTPLVGVRIPDHAFMRRLCQMCGEPLALTSANISSHSSTVAIHEFQDLWPRLAVVVDGGPIGDKSRLGSTVVDLSVLGKYRIIRPGCAFSSTVDVLEHKIWTVRRHRGSVRFAPSKFIPHADTNNQQEPVLTMAKYNSECLQRNRNRSSF